MCARLAQALGIIETQTTALPIALDTLHPAAIELAAGDFFGHRRDKPLAQRGSQAAQQAGLLVGRLVHLGPQEIDLVLPHTAPSQARALNRLHPFRVGPS
ncbi:hypothetical protein THIOKS12350031 [Thiocapsa sp. KS1]|nr:hypothetical protein THIOKS12350031 [Thiocapsa sp. KS1]